jgi:CheY-like chemotaxis protein
LSTPALAYAPHHSKSAADHADPESILFDAAHALPVEEEHFPVLIISRSDADRGCLTRILQSAGLKVSSAASLAEALPMLRRRRVPVVVADCELDDGCWMELWNQVRRLPGRPLPRLVLCSGTDDEGLWATIGEEDAFDLLTKPFVEEEVRWSISDAWHAWKREHDLAV